MHDKNGKEINIGDHLIPDAGVELVAVSERYVADYDCICLFGQQVADPLAFSPLTQENLSTRWTVVEAEAEGTESDNI